LIESWNELTVIYRRINIEYIFNWSLFLHYRKKMPQGKKGVHQQGKRKLKKNLHQSRQEGEKHQTELQSLQAAMKEKDSLVTELRASLTKRDQELNVALEFKEIIGQVQTQNGELQNLACDKLKLMVELEDDNTTLKKVMTKKDAISELKVNNFIYK